MDKTMEPCGAGRRGRGCGPGRASAGSALFCYLGASRRGDAGARMVHRGRQGDAPAAITAAVADPKLGVQAASMLTAHEARLRMVCRVPAACLPFYATATWPESAESVAPPSDRNVGSGERKTPAASAETNESSAGKLRAGASVTLLLEGERVHIQMQAVTLQGGATGDKVRVATRDRKQTYVAEIVNPTLLRGSIPQ